MTPARQPYDSRYQDWYDDEYGSPGEPAGRFNGWGDPYQDDPGAAWYPPEEEYGPPRAEDYPRARRQDVAYRPAVSLSDLLLPASLALWVIGVTQTPGSAPGPYGLPAALPFFFYAGLGLLIVSVVRELSRPRPASWRLALHAGALAVMLYGTAPLVYSQGRYSWLYKTVGVVQYVAVHGHLDPRIDIYQNWPGFFALFAWFDKVAGVSSPLVYAKWAQLGFELAALPLLYLAYDGLRLTPRQRWVAIFLVLATNWIGQDYLSPQAVGTLLSLGVLALALRWLYTEDPARRTRDLEPAEVLQQRLVCAAIVLLFLVIAFTHQLTPYMVTVQIGTLVLARRVRPRWLPVALGAIAIGYLLPRFAFVNSHYGLLANLGRLFSNARPPSFGGGPVSAGEAFVEHAADALSLGVWALAAVGAWHRRRNGQPTVGLGLLAASPLLLLGLLAYGTEGILRVYLFALPWAAALAASVLSPQSPAAGTARAAAALRRAGPSGLRVRATVATFVLGLALFFPAFFGDDSFNVMSSSEVALVTSFLGAVPPGPVYCPIDNAPLSDTANYNLFPVTNMFGRYGVLKKNQGGADMATALAADALNLTHGRTPAYIVITPSMIAYMTAYDMGPAGAIATLRASLKHSGYWQLIANKDGTQLYELPPHLQIIGVNSK